VSTIVRSGGFPTCLPAGFVEALQAYEDNRKALTTAPTGDGEHALSEPNMAYRAQIATMFEMSERDRVLALIALLEPAASVSQLGPARTMARK
jgi:hypothetical protein